MNIIDVLQKKRDGKTLSREEILFFVDSYTNSKIPDYQASAFLMASFINGLSIEETFFLTEAMLNSGQIVNLSSIEGIKVDKHSTGGVGDKTSLIIAPICAACGVPVPMISGRGLGHTGGTLDKLESIPGFNVNLTLEKYKEIIKDIGLCLIGQTIEIAPADKKIYALRDVTSTVENKSLIAASIMSKKLAEGIDALVLDVKTGAGAFMKSEDDAEELTKLLISIGKNMRKNVCALITDMNQPLGAYIGNSLEIIESVEFLKGNFIQNDLKTLCIDLASHMIVLGGKTDSLQKAREMALDSIKSGSALNKFKAVVQKQGGDPSFTDNYNKLPTANKTFMFTSNDEGYISELNALLIGKASVLLDAGRITLDSKIDHSVGFIIKKKIGDFVKNGEILLEVKYNSERKLQEIIPFLKNTYKFSKFKINAPKLIKKVYKGD